MTPAKLNEGLKFEIFALFVLDHEDAGLIKMALVINFNEYGFIFLIAEQV